jgi:acyl-CoA thioesterase II
MSFETDTCVSDRLDGLVATVSSDWEIWGPNGGYLSAIALRAAATRAPAGHRPASLSVQYLARGRFGDARLEVETLREARTAACYAVTMRQSEQRTLAAQVWTTNKTDGPAYSDAAMPDVPPPEALEPSSAYLKDEPAHAFWQHFDAHPVRWPWPGDPDPRGHVYQQWMRFRGYRPGLDAYVDAARAVLLIDTLLWPTHWRGEPPGADYVAPSLDLTVWFHHPSANADWLLLDAAAPVAEAGLIHGHARVWTPDGRLVASGGSNLIHMPLPKA